MTFHRLKMSISHASHVAVSFKEKLEACDFRTPNSMNGLSIMFSLSLDLIQVMQDYLSHQNRRKESLLFYVLLRRKILRQSHVHLSAPSILPRRRDIASRADSSDFFTNLSIR